MGQVPKVMVQEVVKQIPAPAPIVMQAPIVETIAPTYTAPIVSAPIVETFAPTYTAPLVGSISAALPMTTMAAPTMTTMAAPITTGTPFVGTSYGLPPTIF